MPREQRSDRIATLIEKAIPKRQSSQFQHVYIEFRELKGRVLQVIDTKKNKSQLLTVIGMGLTLLLSSCNNSPNKITNAEATQKTEEAGKLLPISEGNYWQYKHEANILEAAMVLIISHLESK